MILSITKENDKYGCINEEGVIVIPTVNDFIRLHEEYIHIRSNNQWGLFNLKGNEILPIVYKDIKVDNNHSGKIIIYDNGNYGMIDINKNVLIPFIYELISFFDYDLMYAKQNDKLALFTTNGERISDFCYDKVWSFFGGHFAKVQKEEKWGFINKNGEEVIPCIYDKVSHEFLQGFSPVNKDGKWGFVDELGNEIVNCIYDNAWGFYDGIARVLKNNKYGFINQKGEEIIPCLYDNVGYDFTEGLLCVKKEEKWGFIDKNGKEIIPIIYDWADKFDNGLATVNIGGVPKTTKNLITVIGGKFGLIDKNGVEIVPVKFKNIDLYTIGRFYKRHNGFDLTQVIDNYYSDVKKRNTLGKHLFEVIAHLINISRTEYLQTDVNKILPVAYELGTSSKLTERKIAIILIHVLCKHSSNNKSKIQIDAAMLTVFKNLMSKEKSVLEDYFEVT